jgi:hypothetical protein
MRRACRYEQEIRRRTDELEKKMRDLDTLNRRCTSGPPIVDCKNVY